MVIIKIEGPVGSSKPIIARRIRELLEANWNYKTVLIDEGERGASRRIRESKADVAIRVKNTNKVGL